MTLFLLLGVCLYKPALCDVLLMLKTEIEYQIRVLLCIYHELLGMFNGVLDTFSVCVTRLNIFQKAFMLMALG